ncbi:MAG: glucose-6-phosphate dehydrogenase [Desulfobacterales bacterium CG2_30_60_27]|nr:MAG: glucose-6-phosphate dehydrogenase [Desulfobacterales bacterium CG2_30_60_27]
MQSCTANTREALSPCTLVIFGASGDLTARKLIPALHGLFCTDSQPRPFQIVGCARTPLNTEAFRDLLLEALTNRGPEPPAGWQKFAQHLAYIPVQYDDAQAFTELAASLRQMDRDHQTQGNRIFYLATPPSLYPVIAAQLGRAGLAAEKTGGNGWVRIVVEKPFGRDLASALELDQVLHQSFHEHQIFRIDHYLAKETVQNILMLRFANTIFEPLWNRGYIDYIGIMAAEQLGVEHRAGYYEQTGILRDMFQNHMQQLLALTAMEPPSLFEAERVRDEKAKCSRSLKPLDRATLAEHLVIGQYGSGAIDGRRVAGYRDEPGVALASRTPTFAMLRLFVDNWRWRDVPFYLISGKRLARKETKIVVQFKRVPHSMFRDMLAERIPANRLTLGIYPDEEIDITFQTKTPGPRVCLRPVRMDFKYNQNDKAPALDAYAKVLLDVIQGDHMLFWRQDGVELAWSFLTPILEECEACGDRAQQLHPYPAGSWGPEAAQEWMRLILNN